MRTHALAGRILHVLLGNLPKRRAPTISMIMSVRHSDSIIVHPTNSTPSQSPTNSAPKLNTRANDGQQISQQVMARAAAVIGTMAFRLTN
jgi:hypothetical protein